MSWNVFLQSVPPGVTSVKQFGDDYRSNLGPKSEVLATLAAILPGARFTSEVGVLDGDDCSIEFYYGDDDPLQSVMLAVRGGDRALEIIERICTHTGWGALDPSAGYSKTAQQRSEGAALSATEWHGDCY